MDILWDIFSYSMDGKKYRDAGSEFKLRDQSGSTAFWPQLAEAWMRETGFLVAK